MQDERQQTTTPVLRKLEESAIPMLPNVAGTIVVVIASSIAWMGQRELPSGTAGLTRGLVSFGIAAFLFVLAYRWPLGEDRAWQQKVRRTMALGWLVVYVLACLVAVYSAYRWRARYSNSFWLILIMPVAFLSVCGTRFRVLSHWLPAYGSLFVSSLGTLAACLYFLLNQARPAVILLICVLACYWILWLDDRETLKKPSRERLLGFAKSQLVPLVLLVLLVLAFLFRQALPVSVPDWGFGVALIPILLLFERRWSLELPTVTSEAVRQSTGVRTWKFWAAWILALLSCLCAGWSSYAGWRGWVGSAFYLSGAVALVFWFAAVAICPKDRRKAILWSGIALSLILQLGAASMWWKKQHPNAALVPFFLSWIPSLVAIVWIDRLRAIRPSKRIAPRWLLWEVIVLVLIVSVGAYFRYWKLLEIPYGIWFDEAREAMDGMAPFEGKPYSPLAYYAWSGTLSFNAYVLALCYKIFGFGLGTARGLVATTGVVTVVAIYLLGRMLIGRGPALVSAAMLACSGWHVNFSRFFMEPPLSVLLVVLCFYFLMRGLRGRRLTDFLLSGAMAGFGVMTYAPTRLLVVMLVVLFLHQCLSRRKFLKTFWYAPLLIVLGGQLTSCPINVAAFTDSALFTARMKQTTVFKPGKPREQAWKDIRTSTGKHLLMFNYKGDPNARHGISLSPKLDPLTGAFFALGIIVCVFRWRRWESALLAFWLLIGLLAGILTLEWEAPQSCRTQLVIPAAMLLAGVPFSVFWQQLKGLFGRWRWVAFLAVVVPLLVWITVWNYRYYFVRMQRDQNVFEEFVGRDTSIARYLASQDLDENFFVHQQSPNDYPAIPFLLNRRDIPGVLYQMPEYIPMRMQVGRKLHYLLEPFRTPFPRELFEHYYPGGEYRMFEDPWKKPIFYTYVVPSDEVESLIGLTATYRTLPDSPDTGREWTRVERSVFDLQVPENAPTEFPVEGHWTGSIFIEQSGDYRLTWSDREPIRMAVGDEALPDESEPEKVVRLIRGWNNVTISRLVKSPDDFFRLMYTFLNRTEQFKQDAFCVRSMPNFGYYGRYYANLEWIEPAHYGIIQPTLSIRWHPEPVRGRLHWSGKWSAYLQADRSGQYGFLIRCNAYCRIEIDGKTVLEQPGQHQNPGRVNIPLDAGEHIIEIFYKEPGQYSELHVLWEPPSGREEIIPHDKLRPKFN